MLVLRGNQALALAYTVHVLDIYDHYKFRAALEEQNREAMLSGKPKPRRPTGSRRRTPGRIRISPGARARSSHTSWSGPQ
jgi:hypothetical protein